jgi:hypothetical protein
VDTARLTVRLTPRADRDAVVGFEGATGDTLRVRVTAPPVEGRANAALVRVLATRLGVGRSAVRVVAGHGARTKIVAVDGLTLEAVRARLDAGDGTTGA